MSTSAEQLENIWRMNKREGQPLDVLVIVCHFLPSCDAAVVDSCEIRHVSLERSEVANLQFGKTMVAGCTSDNCHKFH